VEYEEQDLYGRRSWNGLDGLVDIGVGASLRTCGKGGLGGEGILDSEAIPWTPQRPAQPPTATSDDSSVASGDGEGTVD